MLIDVGGLLRDVLESWPQECKYILQEEGSGPKVKNRQKDFTDFSRSRKVHKGC